MAAKRSFLLRLSPELWEELRRWADEDLRSLNAQIEWLLRDAVRRRRKNLDEDGPDGADDAEVADESAAPPPS